jgi:hypothetical protein
VQRLRIHDPEKNATGLVDVCMTCYWVACGGEDQAVAHLWSALQEGISAGYTDAGFVHSLRLALEARGGRLALGWAQYGLPSASGERQEIEGPFLLAAVPNPAMPTLPMVWCRSRMPAFPALQRACEAGGVPAYEIPWAFPWGGPDRRYFLAYPPEGGEPIDPERNEQVLAAIVTAYLQINEDRDPFAVLAAEGAPAGYELIRRWML